MQGDLQQQAKTALTEHYKDPCSTKKKMILTSWAITNISIFPFFISVVVATGLVSAEGHGGTGFSLIWTFFHTVALLIFGTYVLVKALTPVTYGMLVMACLLMGSWMLQTMVVVGQYNCVNNGTLADDFSGKLCTILVVIIVKILSVCSFLFHCLLLNHSFSTNPNWMTNCFKLFSLLQLYNYICSCFPAILILENRLP